jgi:hypothetical protein
VVNPDQLSLKQYLCGEIETCVQIDQTAAANYLKSILPEQAEAPMISIEKMNEQRQLHAALLEKSIQKSKSSIVPNVATAKLV